MCAWRNDRSRANYCESAPATLLKVPFNDDDDRDRNSSSEETILDGGRARVVFQEERKKFMHV
jgi:hypothetical protein